MKLLYLCGFVITLLLTTLITPACIPAYVSPSVGPLRLAHVANQTPLVFADA